MTRARKQLSGRGAIATKINRLNNRSLRCRSKPLSLSKSRNERLRKLKRLKLLVQPITLPLMRAQRMPYCDEQPMNQMVELDEVDEEADEQPKTKMLKMAEKADTQQDKEWWQMLSKFFIKMIEKGPVKFVFSFPNILDPYAILFNEYFKGKNRILINTSGLLMAAHIIPDITESNSIFSMLIKLVYNFMLPSIHEPFAKYCFNLRDGRHIRCVCHRRPLTEAFTCSYCYAVYCRVVCICKMCGKLGLSVCPRRKRLRSVALAPDIGLPASMDDFFEVPAKRVKALPPP